MARDAPPLPGIERLYDETPCGLLVTTADGTILHVNKTFCAWVGHSPKDLVGKRQLQELFTVGARMFHQTHWLPMLQMQGSISEVKLDVKAAGGRILPMLLNVIRRTTVHGTYDQVSAVVAEDRNKYERELLEARRKADALVVREQDRVEFASQMMGIVSHDLRNPLSTVLLASGALSRADGRLAPEKADRLLGNITRAAQRAQRLIEDLLDFTVARVGKGLSVSRQEIDLHQLAERAIEELGLAFPDRTLLHVPTGPGGVIADADRLVQLLGNLVGNAIAYGDSARPVTITSEVADGVARLTVHNHGPAIPPAMLARIFEPMVRGETAGSSLRSVGLGLFIVKAIAQAHGGDVTVTSTAEGGTTFGLSFPVAALG